MLFCLNTAISAPLQLNPANNALFILVGSSKTIDNTAPIIGKSIKSIRT